jgi:predicted RNA-binding Zn-ribbon protein involved in translation (DUF1610 family)
MGMYDTFIYNCPFCGIETDTQTKLGEQCLDYWRLGDETTIEPGSYRAKDPCTNCGQYSVFRVSADKKLTNISKEAEPDSKQEVLFGTLRPIGTDPEKALNEFADALKRGLRDDEE